MSNLRYLRAWMACRTSGMALAVQDALSTAFLDLALAFFLFIFLVHSIGAAIVRGDDESHSILDLCPFLWELDFLTATHSYRILYIMTVARCRKRISPAITSSTAFSFAFVFQFSWARVGRRLACKELRSLSTLENDGIYCMNGGVQRDVDTYSHLRETGRLKAPFSLYIDLSQTGKASVQ